MTQEHTPHNGFPIEIAGTRRTTDPKQVTKVFTPREDLPEEAKARLTQMVAKSGAVIEVQFT